MMPLWGQAEIYRTAHVANMLKGAVLAALLFFAGTASAMSQNPPLPDRFVEMSFANLEGWEKDDHQAALHSFMRFCRQPEPLTGGTKDAWLTPTVSKRACALATRALQGDLGPKQFFETYFTPYQIAETGFVTGYFEPEVVASRTQTDEHSVPLHRKPAGLEAITESNRPKNWPTHLSHGRRIEANIVEMPDRSAIMNGALDDEGLELVWLRDPIDAYFIHVQGSARLQLADGTTMRVGYAGKTGHPYTGIGRLLVKRGEGTPDDFTMSGLKTWLRDNPDRRDDLFKENRSYIFFREVSEAAPDEGPVGAAGISLVPGRSLAIDHDHFPYGTLVFVSSEHINPDRPNQVFKRLMVADDTGSAINGPARGDIFVGSGDAAGQIAGEIHHSANFTVLVPNTNLTGSSSGLD